MRPRLRFSLKWILVFFAFFGFACYLLFVRPTVLAERFVNLIQSNEYREAESLCVSDSRRFSEYVKSESVVVTVQLHARTWNDIWKMRRRMWVRVIPMSNGDGRNRNSGSADFYAFASAFGVRLDR